MNIFLTRSATAGMIMKPVLSYHNRVSRCNKSSSILLSLTIKPVSFYEKSVSASKIFEKWFRIAQDQGSASAASVLWLGVPFLLFTALYYILKMNLLIKTVGNTPSLSYFTPYLTHLLCSLLSNI